MTTMRWRQGYGATPMSSTEQDWVDEAVTELENNTWKPSTPFYCNGSGWSSAKLFQEEASVRLLTALGRNTSARSFYFHNVILDENSQRALSDVFDKNTHLENVSLRNLRTTTNQQGDETRMIAIPDSLFRNTSLRGLTLEKSVLNKSGCFDLARKIGSRGSLHTLTLDSVDLESDLFFFATALACSSSIQCLTMKNVRISSVEMEILCKSVGKNQSLRRLHLEGLHLEAKHATALADMLRENKHLLELSLRRNDLNENAMDALWHQGMEYNTTLRTLLLSHNPIGDQGAAVIVSSLERNTTATLRRLCLAHCDIWRDGCLAITQGLARIKSLESLNLDGNEMEFYSAELLESLQHNTTLTEVLGFRPAGCKLGDDLARWKEIDLFLRWNKAGRRVLEETNADCLLPTVLAKNSNELDILFKFVQNSQLMH